MSKTFIEDMLERVNDNRSIVNDFVEEKCIFTIRPNYIHFHDSWYNPANGDWRKFNNLEEHEQLYIIRIALKSIPFYSEVIHKESNKSQPGVIYNADTGEEQEIVHNFTSIEFYNLKDLLLQATIADNWEEELEKVWLENKK